MEDRWVRSRAVIGAQYRPAAQIDLGRLRECRMRIGIEIRVAEECERELIGVNFEQIPRRIGLGSGLCPADHVPKLRRNVFLPWADDIRRPRKPLPVA